MLNITKSALHELDWIRKLLRVVLYYSSSWLVTCYPMMVPFAKIPITIYRHRYIITRHNTFSGAKEQQQEYLY